MHRRIFKNVLGLALTLGALCVPQLATAQAWPTKQPIRLVAVFPPGGSVDQVARIIAQPLSQQLGQSVIVENRGGASGVIGTAAVVQAPADGYTFAVVFDTHGVNPALNPNMPFDTKKDLVPLVLVGTSPMVLATNVNSEYKTFKDVVDAAKANKNVSFGTIGNGSLGHLAMSLLGKDARVEWTHVPYKGGGPLMSDAVAGHVPLSIGSVFVTKPHIDNGRMRPLAVTTSKRAADLPNVPTVAENGYPGFEAPAWWAVLASAKTPPDIVKRMNEELNKVLKNPEVAKKLDAQGIDVMGGSSAQASTFIDKQMTIWAKVVKDNNIKAD
ncbi:receptor [Limnohabitans sp. Jir61]|uniref:tripartite tricarboxylate transporter substrate binding protein n=1 Tax=Limnohabitans sp. Jir61 TaxID=1826168 RepID=UPI000D373F35|nr:tripartite tricarboxylate transporter substrate binding protein [Limnohabitans sp. Jir61]PUE31345.1 receptor [Limnohabitans sp. Jir61]